MTFEFYVRREGVLSVALDLVSGRRRSVVLDRLFGPGPSLPRLLWLALPAAALAGGLITNGALC